MDVDVGPSAVGAHRLELHMAQDAVALNDHVVARRVELSLENLAPPASQQHPSDDLTEELVLEKLFAGAAGARAPGIVL